MKKAIGGIVLALSLVLAGCGGGGGSGTTSSSSSGSGSSASKDLSSIAKTPDYSWHSSYLTGTHASFTCGDTCHTLTFTNKVDSSAKVGSSAGYAVTSDRTQICYQCHASNYNATSYLKHSTYNTGTYCNSCHYSDSFTSHTRVSANDYHYNITTGCANCHANRYPSSHASTGRTSGCESCHSYSNGTWAVTSNAHTYTSGCYTCHSSSMPAGHYGTTCESCHSYPSWKGATFNHSGVTSSCRSCHDGHYSPYDCEGCHTSGISWSFNHDRVTSSNCYACHANGTGEDGEGGEGGEDHEGGGDDRRGGRD